MAFRVLSENEVNTLSERQKKLYLEELQLYHERCTFVDRIALKNATNFLHIIQNLFPCVFFTEKNRCIRFTFILHIYFKLHRFIMSNAYIEFCFMPEKHLFLLLFYGLPANMGCSVSRQSQCLSLFQEKFIAVQEYPPANTLQHLRSIPDTPVHLPP